MLTISTTNEWQATHPGTKIGLLEISNVDNTQPSSALNELRDKTVKNLRETYQEFKRSDFLSLPVMSAYDRYYRTFNKTYHVQLQLESIVLKGKNLPSISPAVDSYFIAEVKTLILTAGHDIAKLREPISIDVSHEGDFISQMNGESKPIRAGDMIMRDAEGICCSILYGQDHRSPISASTSHVLYVAYGPKDIPSEAIEDQLKQIEDNIRIFSPQAIFEQRRLLSADFTQP